MDFDHRPDGALEGFTDVLNVRRIGSNSGATEAAHAHGEVALREAFEALLHKVDEDAQVLRLGLIDRRLTGDAGGADLAAGLGVRFEAALFEGCVLEDLDGAGHVADLVAARRGGDLDRRVPFGETAHRAGQPDDRARDRAHQQPSMRSAMAPLIASEPIIVRSDMAFAASAAALLEAISSSWILSASSRRS